MLWRSCYYHCHALICAGSYTVQGPPGQDLANQVQSKSKLLRSSPGPGGGWTTDRVRTSWPSGRKVIGVKNVWVGRTCGQGWKEECGGERKRVIACVMSGMAIASEKERETHEVYLCMQSWSRMCGSGNERMRRMMLRVGVCFRQLEEMNGNPSAVEREKGGKSLRRKFVLHKH